MAAAKTLVESIERLIDWHVQRMRLTILDRPVRDPRTRDNLERARVEIRAALERELTSLIKDAPKK
jgi:hypothetical protein